MDMLVEQEKYLTTELAQKDAVVLCYFVLQNVVVCITGSIMQLPLHAHYIVTLSESGVQRQSNGFPKVHAQLP